MLLRVALVLWLAFIPLAIAALISSTFTIPMLIDGGASLLLAVVWVIDRDPLRLG